MNYEYHKIQPSDRKKTKEMRNLVSRDIAQNDTIFLY